MEHNERLFCQWDPCGAPAAKHIHFGLRVFDVDDPLRISDIPYTPQHRDLCARHAQLAVEQHLHTAVHELGDCPYTEAYADAGQL